MHSWILKVGFLILFCTSAFGSLDQNQVGSKSESPLESEKIKIENRSWTLSGEDEGIKTFRKDSTDDPIVSLRGEGVIDAPVAKVAQVLFDTSRATEWIDSLAETHVVKVLSDYVQVQYAHISTPPIIMKDREFVTRSSVHYNPKDKIIYVTTVPGDDSLVPPTDHIRGSLRGGFLMKPIEDGKKTFLITEMHGDPKGGVPKWIVNLFQAGWAKNTISSIRQQVKKPGIIEHPKVLEVMQKGAEVL
jgi:hypothetical protein